jgi:hypothetical protein
VAKKWMPLRAAMAAVAATVVAPSTPAVAATGRSRTDSFSTPSAVASRVSSSSSRPTTISPPITPIVAGCAPLSRTVCSMSRATARLRGRGSPWEMIVLSSATTGQCSDSAVRTAAPYRTSNMTITVRRPMCALLGT